MRNFFYTLGGKKVAFIGGGVAHRELLVMFTQAGAQVTLCDVRTLADFGNFGEELLALGVRLSLGVNYLNALADQDIILRTPGFGFYTPELQAASHAGALVTSEMELFFENCPCPIIGISGSDGKTTTTTLVAKMLQATGLNVHLGGNIGRAMLPLVDTLLPTDIAVVELSSFQLISMRISPSIAIMTNISPNHLDKHRDMDEYVDAKRNLLRFQSKENIAVLNLENPITHDMEKDTAAEVRWFSTQRKVQNGTFLAPDGFLCVATNGIIRPLVHKDELALRGMHNIENMLAAFAAVFGRASDEAMIEVARTFIGVEHRLEPVRRINNVMWYNDSIATSPTRVMAGLRSFDKKLILLAGGQDKKMPFDELANFLPEHVKLLILTGPAADKIEHAVRKADTYQEGAPEIIRVENLEQAVQEAHKRATSDDVVLLSPACTSFDAFPNFEVRGRHFKDLVNAL